MVVGERRGEERAAANRSTRDAVPEVAAVCGERRGDRRGEDDCGERRGELREKRYGSYDDITKLMRYSRDVVVACVFELFFVEKKSISQVFPLLSA